MNTPPDVDTTKALVEQYVTGRLTADVVALTWQKVGKVIETRFSDDYQVNEIATDHAHAIRPQAARKAQQAGLETAREIRAIAASLCVRDEYMNALDETIAKLEEYQK